MSEPITESRGARTMPWLSGAVVVLALLYWDFWGWADLTLWLGFLPTGLAYHLLYSVACGVLWGWVARSAWPADLEAWAASGDEPGRSP